MGKITFNDWTEKNDSLLTWYVCLLSDACGAQIANWTFTRGDKRRNLQCCTGNVKKEQNKR